MEKLTDIFTPSRDQDREENNGNVIQKLPQEPVHKSSYKSINSLDLNDPSKYRLLDIDQLDTRDYRNVYMNITYLDVSRNSISSLKLKGYNLLETIIATDNALTRVELNLPRLKKLNLTDNMITKIFELNSVPMLEDLVINKNAIKTLTFEDFRSVKNTLSNLELAQNRIEFSNVKEFLELFEQFGKYMKKLRSLNIGNNSFNNQYNKVYREYAEYIVSQCNLLKTLNGKTVELEFREETLKNLNKIKSKMLENEKLEGPLKFNVLEKMSDKKFKQHVSLAIINKEMENYSLMGKLNKATFKDFKILVDSYLMGVRGESQSDGSLKLEDSELDDFETFLEFCNILIDATPSIEVMLIEVVANFVIIKNGKFSYRALAFLQQRLSPDKIRSTEDILSNVVIDYICKSSNDNLSSIIVKGLEPFLVENRFISIFKKLILKLISVLKEFHKLKITNTKSSEENRLKDIYLAAVSFLSVSSNTYEYLTVMIINESLIDCVTGRIRTLLTESSEVVSGDAKAMEILQKLLNIVRMMCLVELGEENTNISNNVSKLVGGGLKDRIEQSLSEKIKEHQRKKDDDNKNEHTLKNIFLNNKLIFANLIRCYGALLFRSDSISVIDSKQSVPMKILNILVQSEMNDPIVISASCDFTLYILNNKKMKQNENGIFEKVTKNLYNLRYLMPYLFQDRTEFKNACLIADSYGEVTMNRGKPIELSNMNSEMINNLIISIVNLIEFFGRHSKKESKIKDICYNICFDLNEQKRDFALCSCLCMMSERVKFAIVACLYSMDCGQFSVDEIGYIWKQITNINLMGGQIEKIVTIIFIILNKCFMYYLKKGRADVVEQNKEAFFLAYDILLKNEERSAVHEIENDNKSILSLAITIFLYNCSSFEQLKQIFLDPRCSPKIHRILYYEESFRESSVFYPIEIEKTRGGLKLLNLFDCFKSERFAITPYTYVSLRILIHIADVLMNIPYYVYDENDADEYDEVIEYFKREVLQRECRRIKAESKAFRKFVEEKIEKQESKLATKLSLSDLKEEQSQFLLMFPLLLDFILGQSTQKTVTKFRAIFMDKFDPKVENLYFSTENIPESASKDDDFPEEEIDENTNIYETFKNYLREEEYYPYKEKKETITEYDYIQQDMLKFTNYGYDEFNLRRLEVEESPDNPYIRSLFISAFLRSVYAVLEFSADKSIKDEMIKLLYKDDVIKQISIFTDCTKMMDNNVASKYLIIMRHVLMNSKIFFEINKPSPKSNNEYLTKIGIISFVIKKMVRVFRNDLKLEDDDHKIFLAEVSRICWIMSNELEAIQFKTDEMKEKTVEVMIGYEIISVLIQIVKEYMNKDSNFYRYSDGSVVNTGDAILNEMVSTISYIIGEYMSKCKKYSYRILEEITRSFMFDHVKMRKTYLKEILEYSKLTDLKVKINQFLGYQVNYVTRVYITDCKTGNSYLKLLVLTSSSIEFLDVNDPEEEKSDWNMTEFNFNEELKILFEEIDSLISFDLHNRLLMKTKKTYYNMFFLKTQSTSFLMMNMKINNSNIRVYDQVPIFLEDEELVQCENKLEEYTQSLTRRADFHLLDEETDSPGNDFREDKNQDQQMNNSDKKPTVVIFCVSVVKKFFDFLTKMFKKSELIKDGKVIVIKDSKLKIYEESYDEWQKLNVIEIFEKAHRRAPKKGIFLGNFIHCYNCLAEFDLGGVTDFTAMNVNQIDLIFSDGSDLKFTILDDLSFVQFKKSIFPFLKNNNLPLKDDYYDDIK